MRLVTVSMVVLLLSLARVGTAETPSVTTSGTATVYVTPDRAYVTLSIQTVDKDIATARTNNNTKATRVVETIKAAGIAAADIATERVSITEHQDAATRKPDGFLALQFIGVTVKNLANLDRMVDAVVRTGSATVPHVELQVTEMRRFRDQARDLAIKAAREKAKALAKALDADVGKPLTIIEGGNPVLYGAYGGLSNNVQAVEMAPAAVPDTPEFLPLGKIEVQASISVTFELK